MTPADAPDRFEALCASAVAMLDPIVTEDSDWIVTLADRLTLCASQANGFELTAFARLANHLAGRLEVLHKQQPDQLHKDKAGAWVACAIEYCSGQLPAERVDQLTELLEPWATVRDAASLSSITVNGGADEAAAQQFARRWQTLLGKQGLALAGAVGSHRPSDIAKPCTVAIDELQMLAESCDEIGAQCEALLERARTRLSTRRFLRALDSLSELWRRLGRALAVIGLNSAAGLFTDLGRGLQPAVWRKKGVDADLLLALQTASIQWGHWFREPGQLGLGQALAAHEAALIVAWREPGQKDMLPGGPNRLQSARTELVSIELIGSRRIEVSDDESLDDSFVLNLAIPTSADREVAQQLLTELPALSDAFSQAVSRLTSGDSGQLAAARRLAHTVKGAANTVGVDGIGRFTHALEDMLQLLSAAGEKDLSQHHNLLLDASDCLADMVDAIVEQAPSPESAPTVYRAIVSTVEFLMDRPIDPSKSDPDRGDTAPVPLDLGEFELPDLTLGDDSDTPTQGFFLAPPPVSPVQPTQDNGVAVSVGTLTEPAGVGLRLSSGVIDQVLEAVNEAIILLSQVRETTAGLGSAQNQSRLDSERLVSLAAELDRLVDAAPSNLDSDAELDPLEMEKFGDLHAVSRRITEVGADGKLRDHQMGEHLSRLQELTAKLGRLQAKIREDALAARMVPAESVTGRLQRAARQAARMAGKQAQLTVIGGHTAIDGELLQRLVQPMSHLIRNAIDHGIETTSERTAAGKDATGNIALSFARESSNLRIVVQDDGAGLDVSAIEERARQLRLIPPGAGLDEKTAAQLILAPGFSTRAQASQLSGRGIGLDVVSQMMRTLKGDLNIVGTAGSGTCVELSIPMRMSTQSVFVLRLRTHVLALSVRGVEQILASGEAIESTRAGPRLTHAGRLLEVRRLDAELGLPSGLFAPASGPSDQPGEVVLLVQTAGGGLTALLVPALGQTQPVVVRRLPANLPHIAGIDGVAILGDGSVAPVVDLPELIATSVGSSPDARSMAGPIDASGLPIDDAAPLCLIVDDSVSVRRASAQLVGDLGMCVQTARDASEAMQRIAEREPALIITDLEMPGLNGIEFTRRLRAEACTATVPILMITSRDSQRHRDLAAAAGVTEFVTKPYDDVDLAQLISDLLTKSGATTA